MIGRQVSHFYVLRNLGSGGMGVVYEAQDTRLPRSVALKFLKPSLAKHLEAVRRFKREARLASSLNHPNICTILDVDECDGQSFIAMELLQGRSLRDRLAAGSMDLDELLDVATQTADALAAAHAQDIMHRDITPRNIFVTGGGLVKLLDFGLAKYLPRADDDAVTDDITQTGAVAGTIHYMAPEHFAAGAHVDHHCDLFSLGAVLYEMATGSRPFEARSKHEIIALIQQQPHIPVRRLAPHHPAQLERLVDRLLSKSPSERGEAAALRDELDALRRRGGSRSPRTGDRHAHPAALAILPFEAIGTVAAEGFCEGLARDISSRLAAAGGIRIAPSTSTRTVASRTIHDISEQLGVQLVLEGTVQQADSRVRVTANLVNGGTERSALPPVRVERRFGDLLTVQDEIAAEIANAIAPALVRANEQRHTNDAEALSAYRRGQHHWRGRHTGGWRLAIEAFQAAIHRDDRFALAHLALGTAYDFLGSYCLMKPGVAFGIAREAVERALHLDDTLAGAHTELALVKFGGDWDWDGSEAAFRRAIQLDPGSAPAHVCYAWLLMLLGREDAALNEARKGHALAPSSRFVTAGRAQALYLANRYDEAIEISSQCLMADPDYVFALAVRGQCYELKSMFEEAVTDLERVVALTERTPYYLGVLGHCYGQSGRRADALRLVTELEAKAREMYVPPQSYVFIHAGLGERARALEHQEKAYVDGASPFNYLAPYIRDLYALDPHHKKRLQQMRLIL